MKNKKVKPIYATDKYGMTYQVNKPLSDNDKELLKQLAEMVKKREEKK